MAYNKLDHYNRNLETGTNRWEGLTIVPANGGGFDRLKITTRLPSIVANFKSIILNTESKTREHLLRSVKAAAIDAAETMLPVKDEQFDKGFARRTRNSRMANARANSSWKVGYNTGSTKDRFVKSIKDANLNNLVKITDKTIQLSYIIPKSVAMKLFPQYYAKYDYKLPIHAVEEWVRSDKNKPMVRNWNFNGKRRDEKSIAFAICKSWQKTWKPSILNKNALSISRNSDASQEFSSSLESRLSNLPNSMVQDFNNAMNNV